MATPASLKVIDPTRIWLVVTGLMLVILVASATGVWRLAATENQHLVEEQLDILTRSRLGELEHGNYRSFVDGAGKELSGMTIAISGDGQTFALGTHSALEHCAVSDPIVNLASGHTVTATLCRPFRSPLPAIVVLVAVFVLVAGGAFFILLRFERGAVRSLGGLFTEYGLGIDSKRGLGGILARVKDMAGELRAAQARETTMVRSVAIAETAQMIAHDVKRPFATLDMALDALSSETDPAAITRLASRLQPEVRRALGAARSMLADINEVASTAPMIKEPTAIAAIIDHCLADPGFARQAESVQITQDLQQHRVIECDATKVQRVIANILANAVQATNGRGRIWIKTRDADARHGACIEIAIGNDGPTISSADLPKIFDSFFTKGKKDGTGLGLAIVKKIVEAHGGSIRCTSSVENGTEFVMTLPASSDLEMQAPPAECQPMLLIVDDDAFYGEIVAGALAQRLESIGVVVQAVTSYSEAVAKAAATPPLAAICDINLGEGVPSGFKLARDLTNQKIPVLLHSSLELESVRDEVAASGARAFLPKPTSVDRMLAALREFLPANLPARSPS